MYRAVIFSGLRPSYNTRGSHVIMSKHYYLSEATQLNQYERGKINLLFAPVGSGKTYYTGTKLPPMLDTDKVIVYLAPYLTLRSQVVSDGLFVCQGDDHRDLLDGFLFIENGNIEDLMAGPKVAMTTQSFMWMAHNNPEMWDCVGAVIFDEFDHIIYELPKWERGRTNSPFTNIRDTLIKYCDRTYIIGMTATQDDRIERDFGIHCNKIQFKEKIRRYIPNMPAQKEFDDIYIAIDDFMTESPTLKFSIYSPFVRNCTRLKAHIEQNHNKKCAIIVSASATSYEMNDLDIETRQQIIESGTIPDNVDVLIFNAVMERGVNIRDERYKDVFVHDSNLTTRIQVVGRFRFHGVVPRWQIPTNRRYHHIETISEAIDKVADQWLTKEQIEGKLEFGHYRDHKKRPMTLNKFLKEYLPEGYSWKKKRLNTKDIKATLYYISPPTA